MKNTGAFLHRAHYAMDFIYLVDIVYLYFKIFTQIFFESELLDA